MVLVWDRLVRSIHWGVALLVAANFFNDDGEEWHRYAGYAAAALVMLRLVWGVVGSRYAAFASWHLRPGLLFAYLRSLGTSKLPRYLGLNPAGAFMAIMIWVLIIALALTGWMMGLDAYWGEEWLQQLHAALAYVLLGCVAVHVTAVIAVSIRSRENLVKAMLTGVKRDEDEKS